ncbi:uncharacterized protein LOC113290540 [Papaver somniferum]|uniref:uncharacterized protein LOC113290540 n=1 Tax=Papaver somniferum TaxID=3469 RepID=UPI000E6FED8F|nr:uncharacterized protein LOC113290540 [Papaver somniferum]
MIILLTGSSDFLIQKLIVALSKEFAMKDLGNVHYFLGIEASRTDNAIVLIQQKYTLELLSKEQMLKCKPCDTPVAKCKRFSIHDGVLLDDPLEYKTIVGSLQYLTYTSPDICFGVNYVSQFMHALTDQHILLVKKILRYLKGTICAGISLQKGDIHSLLAYTDSEWAGCPDTRRSTSGYVVFMVTSVISWSSKTQPTFFRSSAEVEYKCLILSVGELQWLTYIMTKHVEVNYHTIREVVGDGSLRVVHVIYEEQLADVFTKGMCYPTFTRLLSGLLHFPATTADASSANTTTSTTSVADAD